MASEMPSDTLTFEKALRVVSPTINSSDLYKLLTFIRKSVEWPQHRKNINKIYKSGCIKKILACLTSSRSNIIAVSLSILGNCCLDPNCSNEVASKGLNDLYNLMQRFSKEDGVNGRIFRIIGNICQHNVTGFILKSKIFSHVLKFIQKYADDDDSKFSEATILMAVRAVGKFMNRQTYSTLVDKYEMLKPIGALFIKCCTRWTTEKKDEAVLNQIIKFLYKFSKYKYSPGISQLRSTSKGDCLVYFHQILPLAPQTLVNIIMNFISVSRLKSDIPVRDITATFVKLLREASLNKDEIKKSHKDYIKCLCFLLDDPINRDPDRCDETIPQLIRTLDDVQDPSNDMIEVLCLILETFERCNYHQNIMKQQLSNNIVEVLVKKLENMLGNRNLLKMKHKLVKKKVEEDSKTSNKKRFWDSLPDSSDDDMDMHNAGLLPFRPSSPGSGSDSEMIASPWASPRATTPPVESSTFYLQESDSEDYSPVCSEDECCDNESAPEITPEEIEDFAGVRENQDCEDLPDAVEKISEEDLKYRLIHHSLSLLKVYSFIQPLPPQLCSDALMMVLVKCACYFDASSKATNMAKTVVLKILSVNDNLLPLMQSDVIYSVFSLGKTEHGSDCERCNHFKNISDQVLAKFSELMESGGGIGNIANRLYLGKTDQKRQLAMTIPYIVERRGTMHTLMITCMGVEILSDCLRDENLRKKCLEVIFVLAKKHFIMLEPCGCTLSRGKLTVKAYKVSRTCKNVVTFVLDDDSRLSADRDALCQKSAFFNTLLSGAFKESNEDLVKLQQTKHGSLQNLMSLLSSDLDMSKPKDIQLDTDVILDVIMLCHRYLLEELCVYLTKCVRQFRFTPENLPSIYKWSLESSTNILRTESVTYALRGSTTMCEATSVFMKFFDLGFTDVLIDDIQGLLFRNITYFIDERYKVGNEIYRVFIRIINLDRSNLSKFPI